MNNNLLAKNAKIDNVNKNEVSLTDDAHHQVVLPPIVQFIQVVKSQNHQTAVIQEPQTSVIQQQQQQPISSPSPITSQNILFKNKTNHLEMSPTTTNNEFVITNNNSNNNSNINNKNNQKIHLISNIFFASTATTSVTHTLSNNNLNNSNLDNGHSATLLKQIPTLVKIVKKSNENLTENLTTNNTNDFYRNEINCENNNNNNNNSNSNNYRSVNLTTLEQLREFDLVLEQVKVRSNVKTNDDNDDSLSPAAGELVVNTDNRNHDEINVENANIHPNISMGTNVNANANTNDIMKNPTGLTSSATTLTIPCLTQTPLSQQKIVTATPIMVAVTNYCTNLRPTFAITNNLVSFGQNQPVSINSQKLLTPFINVGKCSTIKSVNSSKNLHFIQQNPNGCLQTQFTTSKVYTVSANSTISTSATTTSITATNTSTTTATTDITTTNNAGSVANIMITTTSSGNLSAISSPSSTTTNTTSSLSPQVSPSTTALGNHTTKVPSSVPKQQQKPQEDEHTMQRIYDILAEYAEQLRNSPDLNNKPAPRRRSNPPTTMTAANSNGLSTITVAVTIATTAATTTTVVVGTSTITTTTSSSSHSPTITTIVTLATTQTNSTINTTPIKRKKSSQHQQSGKKSNNSPDLQHDDHHISLSEDSSNGTIHSISLDSTSQNACDQNLDEICSTSAFNSESSSISLLTSATTITVNTTATVTTTISSLLSSIVSPSSSIVVTATTNSVKPLVTTTNNRKIILTESNNNNNNNNNSNNNGSATAAVLVPGNYLIPMSMMKSGQQIAVVATNGNKLLAATIPQTSSTTKIHHQSITNCPNYSNTVILQNILNNNSKLTQNASTIFNTRTSSAVILPTSIALALSNNITKEQLQSSSSSFTSSTLSTSSTSTLSSLTLPPPPTSQPSLPSQQRSKIFAIQKMTPLGSPSPIQLLNQINNTNNNNSAILCHIKQNQNSNFIYNNNNNSNNNNNNNMDEISNERIANLAIMKTDFLKNEQVKHREQNNLQQIKQNNSTKRKLSFSDDYLSKSDSDSSEASSVYFSSDISSNNIDNANFRNSKATTQTKFFFVRDKRNLLQQSIIKNRNLVNNKIIGINHDYFCDSQKEMKTESQKIVSININEETSSCEIDDNTAIGQRINVELNDDLEDNFNSTELFPEIFE